MNDDLAPIITEIGNEAIRAYTIHGPYASYHEAYAVLLEEVDEMWDEIKKRNPNKDAIRLEAIQIGAVIIRMIYELLGEDIKEWR